MPGTHSRTAHQPEMTPVPDLGIAAHPSAIPSAAPTAAGTSPGAGGLPPSASATIPEPTPELTASDDPALAFEALLDIRDVRAIMRIRRRLEHDLETMRGALDDAVIACALFQYPQTRRFLRHLDGALDDARFTLGLLDLLWRDELTGERPLP